MTGISLLFILQSINAILLLLGFQAAKRYTGEKAKRGLSQQSRLGSSLAFITLIYLTLPALGLWLL